ncbi:T9SS type A sorting domain-containing protein [Pedobacter sp. SD-b]|uniref:T9SS type A sorting domain-containing protein n=1 Tax=Pedobacter segetis TaxID=2793069 RepID=A0ABS1BME4_9SPHI|nr:T9SS type A sorting domain-containing protein [Pedobacter segetis]MBK0384060.1 T9SS type A sorting domain-containing protein [Pedobacter segetis]
MFLLCGKMVNGQMLWLNTKGSINASENQQTVNNLFDNDISTTWTCSGKGTILFTNKDNPYIFTGYGLYSSTQNSPKSSRFYGSLDGINYDILDSEKVISLLGSSRKIFTTQNVEQYLYYKIEVFDTENFASSGKPVELSGLLFEANGKTESFENLQIGTATSNNGSYKGDYAVNWTYTNSRDAQNYGAQGKALMMRGQDGASLTATVNGGVTRLSFDYTKAFETAENETAYFEVYLQELETGGAETKVGVSVMVGNTPIKGIKTFILDNLDYRGKVKITVKALGKPVCIDNLGYFPNSLKPVASADNDINNTFIINTDSVKWQISNYLVGMHSVYSSEPDKFYADGSYAKWLKDTHISTMRYPGGTVVKYWDWEHPTGILNQDSWDPKWDTANNAPAENWLSLDEYIAVVKASGITPLFGVNITSGYKYNRVQESIDRAARMVQHVKDAGLGGAFWYLGNEGTNGSPANEANLFKQHAMAMKAIDPNIKCMFNNNNLTPEYLKNYLAIAGDYIDIAETHGKWPYGGTPGLPPGTFEEWQKEFPLRDRKNHNREWRNEVPILQQAAAEAGYPNLKFADNEYGLGSSQNLIGFDRYLSNLLVIDMLQEHIIGNWFMSCYWSQILSNSDATSVASGENNFRLNAMHYGFELLGIIQGAKMLGMTAIENNISVYGFAAEKDNEYYVYLLNKSNLEQNVNLNFIGSGSLSEQFSEGKSLVNTPDEFGEMKVTGVTNDGKDGFKGTLPPMSYTRFIFKKGLSTSAQTPQKSNFLIKVYPNPVTDDVNISSDSNFRLKFFTIYSSNGQKVKQGNFNGKSTIQLNDLKAGTYFIHLFDDKANSSFVKVIKQNN